MLLFALVARAAEPVAMPPIRPPISEIDHPRYVDAAGAPIQWGEVRSLSANSGARGEVRRRRIGRTILRITFAAATAAEIWGTMELARDGRWTAYPLAAQASLTGLCEVLLWTNTPQYLVEDRAIVLGAANAALVPRR